MLHAAAAVVLLLVAMALSVYKPLGMTRYGQRKQHQQRRMPDLRIPHLRPRGRQPDGHPRSSCSSALPRELMTNDRRVNLYSNPPPEGLGRYVPAEIEQPRSWQNR